MSLNPYCPSRHTVTSHFECDTNQYDSFYYFPEKNISTDISQTEFVRCEPEEAELYAIYGKQGDDCELLADCCCEFKARITIHRLILHKSKSNQ